MPRLIALSLAGLIAGPAVAACGIDHSDFVQALQRQDLDRAAVALRNGRADPACDPAYLDGLEHGLHQAVQQRAQALIEAERYAAARALLDRYQPAGWHTLALRGDLAAAAKRWPEAARSYGRAYEIATLPPEGERTRPRAKPGELLALYTLASEAQALAGSLDASLSRGGEPRGVFISRGPKPSLRPVPVQFVFAQAKFTAAGRANAERLAAYLKRLAPKDLLLVGHTDPIGDEAYNLDLSLRRAERLATFLRARGLEAEIRTRGLGEAQPPRLSDPKKYTRQERHALYRRVEFRID